MRTIVAICVAFALAFSVAGGNASAKTTPKAPVKVAPAKSPVPSPKQTGTLYKGTVKEVYPEDRMFALKLGAGRLPYAVKILPTTRIVAADGTARSFTEVAAGKRISVRGKLGRSNTIQANVITLGS